MTPTMPGNMSAPTKKRVLLESLTIFEALKKRSSRNLNGLTAEPGLEKEFIANDLRCRVLRGMIQDLEGGKPIQEEAGEPGEKAGEARGLADWQKEIMDNPAYRETAMKF